MRKWYSLLLVALFYVQVPALHAQTAGVAPNPKDPLYQAKGDNHRSYAFPGTGQSMPYRVYVPAKWNKDAKLPMLVILHSGASLDRPFDERSPGTLIRVAEEKGFIVLSPKGFGEQPRYNTPYGAISANGTVSKYERDPRSEQDVMNATELVAKEYNVDRSRIYLFSNSHAGAGVWYMGEQHPNIWAAIAVASSPISASAYPFERLKNVALLVIHGTHDDTMSYDAAFRMAKTAKEKGVDAEFLPVMNGTHLEAWTVVLPQMLDFFARHPKK